MDRELQQAVAILRKENRTCVLCKNTEFFSDSRRGVLPLLAFLDSGKDFSGFCAADKVVGKAAAFLYCLLGVKALWAGVISRPALEVLQRQGIAVQYETLSDAILNRSGTGFCPMESATRELSDPQTALFAIRETLKSLK
jgi:hypothetical protein